MYLNTHDVTHGLNRRPYHNLNTRFLTLSVMPFAIFVERGENGKEKIY